MSFSSIFLAKNAHLTQDQLPWSIKILTQQKFVELSKDPTSLTLEQLQYFAHFGVLAPTSHNTVPQRFKFAVEKSSIEIWLDRHFVLPVSDKVGRQALVSLGCVIANIELAAQTFGWEAVTDLVSIEPKYLLHIPDIDSLNRFTHIATIAFSPSITPSSPQVLKDMVDRKVLRAEYDKTVHLTDELEQKLYAVMDKYPGTYLHIIKNQLLMRTFGKFQENADRFVMENKAFAQELGEWLIPNDQILPPYAMKGIEFGFDDEFAVHIHQGLKGEKRLLPDQIMFFAKGGKAGIESSSAVAVLSVEKDDVSHRIDAGRAYEELALLLYRHNFFTSMHAGITEVDWVNATFAATVLKTRFRPTAVFRIGKPKRVIDGQRPHSARPLLEDVTLT